MLHAYSGMLEFLEQVLELSMPVARGTKGSLRPPVGSGTADNDSLNLRVLLRAIFYIISSSGHSPEELFLRSGNSPASHSPRLSVQLSVCKHFLSSHLHQDHWSDFFFQLGQNVPLSA